jgi:hypothetical protein
MSCSCRFISTGEDNEGYCFGLEIDEMGMQGKFAEAANLWLKDLPT